MNETIARNHHFVPRSYLAAFTESGKKSGRIFVSDFMSRSTFWTNTRNIAAARDFNRVDLDGYPPDAIERSLGEFESKVAPILQRIRDTGLVPSDEDLSFVINLMALLVVRNPKLRRSMNTALRHEVRIIGDLLMSDRRLYEHHVAKAKAEGFIDPAADVSFEDMKRFIEKDDYTVELSSSVLSELEVFQNALNSLGSRYWSLVTAAPEGPPFVTCDHPVAVVFRDTRKRGPIGYGMPETEVTFPLGPNHTLLGVLERPFKESFVAAPKHVAMVNTRTVNHADRQVYSNTENVIILHEAVLSRLDVSAA